MVCTGGGGGVGLVANSRGVNGDKSAYSYGTYKNMVCIMGVEY